MVWQILFWGSVGVVFYAYFGYPILLFLLCQIRKKRPVASTQTDPPTVRIFISVFNEEKVIRNKIENALSLDYPKDKLRILVASDGSTDRTVSIAGDYNDYGVKLIHFNMRKGKSAVINEVIGELDDEVVVFTDANAHFAKDSILHITKHFSDPEIGCVVGKLRYIDRHTSCVGKGEGIYWKYEAKISQLESRLKSVLVANGSFFAIRRKLFKTLYPDVANDFQIPADVANQGYGVVYEPNAVAIERSTVHWREEFQRKVRIVLRGITGFSQLAGRFKGFRLWQFVSHKLLRWCIGLFMIIAFAANALLIGNSLFYNAAFVLQSLFYILAFNGWRLRRAKKPRRLFYVPFYLTMVNFAALAGMCNFLRGKRQSTWEKAESARFSPIPNSSDNVDLTYGRNKENEISEPKISIGKK